MKGNGSKGRQTSEEQTWITQCETNNYCVLCTIQGKKENKNVQQRILSSLVIIPLC